MAGNSTESTHGSLDAGVPQAGGGGAAEPLYGAVFRESRGIGAVAAEKRARRFGAHAHRAAGRND